MRRTIHRSAFITMLLWGLACGDDKTGTQPDSGTDSPPAGSGGVIGSGGRATGGSTGSGGGSGGSTAAGGRSGSGGVIGMDGGLGTGGGGTGGRGGTGGTTGLDAGRLDATPDQVTADLRIDLGRDLGLDTALDGIAADSPADTPLGTDAGGDTGPAMTLESCFVGLRAQVGAQMIATKSTADGRVRMRIALDTEDRMGTSGSYGWDLIRLAVEVDSVVTCMTDRTMLDYTGSHHNCSDKAIAQSGTATYTVAAPDRPTATLTIESNGTARGPYTLTDTTCTMSMSPGVPITCRSGGPC